VKVLLLNSTYQPIAFLNERRAIRLFFKNKVEVVSSWEDETLRWSNGEIKLPSIIRLKYYVKWIPKKSRFNRIGVFKRDKFICMYCGEQFKTSDLTIDHILPKSQGGHLSWHNCVCSCYSCNSKKGDRTPEQAGMRLLKQPIVPISDLAGELFLINHIHPDWKMYLGQS